MARDRWLLLIAAFKLVKAVLLIAAGIGFFSLIHKDITEVAEHWIDVLRIDPDNQHIHGWLARLGLMDDRTLKELGVGTFCYAGVFLTEGTGLLLRKRWARYLTIIVTTSFLPLEVIELIHSPGFGKAMVLPLNVAIVIYLILHRNDEQNSSRRLPAQTKPRTVP